MEQHPDRIVRQQILWNVSLKFNVYTLVIIDDFRIEGMGINIESPLVQDVLEMPGIM